LEGNGHALIEVLSVNLFGETEENHKNPQDYFSSRTILNGDHVSIRKTAEKIARLLNFQKIAFMCKFFMEISTHV
jgi:hypothetical protein